MRVRSKAQRMAKMSPRQIKQMEKKTKANKAKKRGFHLGPTPEQLARSIHKKLAKQFGRKYQKHSTTQKELYKVDAYAEQYRNMHQPNYDVVVDSDNPKHIDVRVGHTRYETAAQEIVNSINKHKYKIGVSVARHGFEY